MRTSYRGRRLASASAACVLLLALPACGGDKSGGSAGSNAICPDPNAPLATAAAPNTKLSGTVTFWGWTNDAPKAVLADFNKAYPNIKVEVQDVGSEDMSTKLLTALRAGRGAPDVSEWQDDDAPSVWNLPLANLTACMKPHLKDFPDFKVKNITRPDGSIQAVPWEAGPMQLAYRRDIFQQYNIDPASM